MLRGERGGTLFQMLGWNTLWVQSTKHYTYSAICDYVVTIGCQIRDSLNTWTYQRLWSRLRYDSSLQMRLSSSPWCSRACFFVVMETSYNVHSVTCVFVHELTWDSEHKTGWMKAENAEVVRPWLSNLSPCSQKPVFSHVRRRETRASLCTALTAKILPPL